MLFNSYVFLLLFLPAVLLGAALLGRASGGRAVLAWLVLASLAFYAWWSPPFVLLFAGSILLNFALGARIAARAGAPAGRAILVLGIVVNLGLLGWFKYANFLLDAVNGVSDTGLRLAAITLPVGISFYTFQQIAFLVDAFRGETREVRLVDYALFVSFFPQLIAGPIVHHREMLPQFRRRGRPGVRTRALAVGLTILAVGLFKKVVLADSAALHATPVFRAADAGYAPALGDAWLGSLAYAMQIYFDFSGYSDMAIGLGALFGIRLPLNFSSPYKAASIVEFWRRWHRTLSRFLRDYLYVPLGGNRRGPVRRYANLLATMGLGGLWHGAGWTFLAWGLLHGTFLCLHHAWAAAAARLGIGPGAGGRPRRAAGVLLTFVAVTVGWVFFRAATFDGAGRILAGMAGANGTGMPEIGDGGPGLRLVAALLLAVWVLPSTQEWMRRWRPAWEQRRGAPVPEPAAAGRLRWSPPPGWALATAALAATALAWMARASEFIYYQF
jgi:D-alanyl-lipoteichoic acid acyltransferase DltB (MBOAT superfamily)